MHMGGKLFVDSTCTIVNDTIVCQAAKPTNVFTPRLTAQLLGLYESMIQYIRVLSREDSSRTKRFVALELREEQHVIKCIAQDA